MNALDKLIAEAEGWRAVLGYEGVYEVSNLGRVRNLRTGRVLKFGKCGGNGRYRRVSLHLNGKLKASAVHRLVLEAFVGPCPKPGMQAAHLDGNPRNNAPTNLAWVTPAENTKHKYRHGTILFGEKHPNCTISVTKARAILDDYRTGMSFSALARKYGHARSAVTSLVKGERRFADIQKLAAGEDVGG